MDNFFDPSRRASLILLSAALVASVEPALGSLVISSHPTRNMDCSAGLCEPTTTNAVLNVSDLESLLGSGDLTVTTAGSGVDAGDIEVTLAFSWSTGSALALDATGLMYIDDAISSAMGNLSLTTANNVPLTNLRFGQRGRIVLSNLSSEFIINRQAYTLVDTISSLASAIASNPSGAYAFANNYDASQDGTYTNSPIQTIFNGAFEGLGNTISRLSIDDESSSQENIGLFYSMSRGGSIEHVRLVRAKVVGGKTGVADDRIGTLVGYNETGYLFQDTATGNIRFIGGKRGLAGGLTGLNSGNVDSCFARVTIKADEAGGKWGFGGLVGSNETGLITDSFASGAVVVKKNNWAGGLVGFDFGQIRNSYATGAVSGGAKAEVGGLIGFNKSLSVQAVYSTGAVAGGTNSHVGGFAGKNGQKLTDSYWDTTTSGTTQGVGEGNSRGITGLTTEQLQSGLPQGFDPSVWGEKPKINGGLPYLLANPPPK